MSESVWHHTADTGTPDACVNGSTACRLMQYGALATTPCAYTPGPHNNAQDASLGAARIRRCRIGRARLDLRKVQHNRGTSRGAPGQPALARHDRRRRTPIGEGVGQGDIATQGMGLHTGTPRGPSCTAKEAPRRRPQRPPMRLQQGHFGGRQPDPVVATHPTACEHNEKMHRKPISRAQLTSVRHLPNPAPRPWGGPNAPQTGGRPVRRRTVGLAPLSL